MKNYLIFWPCLVLIVTGGSLWLSGYAYTTYYDEEAVRELNARGSMVSSIGREEFKKQYYEEMKALRTPRNRLLDVGHSFVSLGISVAVFLIIFRIRRISDLRKMQTPKSRGAFLKWINLAFFSSMFSSFIYYTYKAERGDYPWFADSTGIPIMSQSFFSAFFMLVMSLLWLRLLKYRNLPVALWIWPTQKQAKKWVSVVVFGVFIVLTLLCLYKDIFFGNFTGIPIHLAWIYIWLSSRAAITECLIPSTGMLRVIDK